MTASHDLRGSIFKGMGLATRIALVAGLVGLLSIVALTGFILRGSEQILLDRDTQRLAGNVAVSAERLRSLIEYGRQDALLLAKTPPAIGTFRAMGNGGTDPQDGSTEALWRDRLAAIFEGMLEARPEYTRVRLISFGSDGLKDGHEIVRVNRLPGDAIRRVPESELQDKSTRPFVIDTRKLAPGEVYLSPIDFEQDQGRIVTPHVAAIRAATPVVDERGRKLGMVLINIDMGRIFTIVRGPRVQGTDYFITNQDGDFLAHPDPARNFGFERGIRYRLQQDYPQLAPFLKDGARRFTGTLDTPQGRVLAMAVKVDYDPLNTSQFAIIGQTMQASELDASLLAVRNRALAAAAVVLLAGLLAIAWLTRSLSRPLRDISDMAVAVARGERQIDPGAARQRSDEVGALARSFETMVQRVEERERDLLEAEARTSRVIDVMPEAILVTDRDGIIRRVNDRAITIFGYGRDELLGQPVEMLIPERSRAGHPAQREAYVASPEIRPMGAGRDLYGRRKDGREVPVEIALAPLGGQGAGGQGGDGQIVVSVADITARKAAQDVLRDTNEKLARSNQELMQFAYVASHDLQEPLRMVDSYMGLIERRYKGKLDSDADEFIGYAVDGARRMKRLINDLLAYSRVSNRPLRIGPVDVRAVLDDVLALYDVQIRGSGAVVELGTLPVIEGDAGQIERLFANLVGNALKFRSDHSPHISIGARRKGDMWEFTIADNGIGIDPEFNEKIFEIFSRLHSREQYEGTGIGLAACRRIVELHGGMIWVEPGRNGGSLFLFTLPERQKEQESQKEEAS
ncbi:PAS domain S-box protein [Altererythrobacter sp. CC-YST694]|uniref:sensor histidine kinase n=1 Tax=Altererythrobacter sp. CC-YST694 TaxID=2755038 RepID=UPI001D018A44|nr:ATP-binding protein [Altererythrobacter sp. CC-YST694]MCB5423785.1 PAS domain S-box protein [Altererythrobacter sp. CC-YST694]